MTLSTLTDNEIFDVLYQAYLRRDTASMEHLLAERPSLVNLLSPNTEISGLCGLIHQASSDNDVEMIAFLLDHNANIHLQSTDSPLSYCSPHNSLARAVVWGGKEAVRLLLERGFQMDNRCVQFDEHPLRLALQLQKADIVDILAGQVFSPEHIRKFDLYNAAVTGGRQDIMHILEKVLVENGTPLTQEELNTALYYTGQIYRMDASPEERILCAKHLLDKGAQPDAFFSWRHSFGVKEEAFSVINTLAMNGKHDLVQLLLARTGTPVFKTRSGQDFTLEYIANNDPDMLILLKSGNLLQQEFELKKIQPAIDRIYYGGDKPLPLPKMRR